MLVVCGPVARNNFRFGNGYSVSRAGGSLFISDQRMMSIRAALSLLTLVGIVIAIVFAAQNGSLTNLFVVDLVGALMSLVYFVSATVMSRKSRSSPGMSTGTRNIHDRLHVTVHSLSVMLHVLIFPAVLVYVIPLTIPGVPWLDFSTVTGQISHGMTIALAVIQTADFRLGKLAPDMVVAIFGSPLVACMFVSKWYLTADLAQVGYFGTVEAIVSGVVVAPILFGITYVLRAWLDVDRM